MRTDKLDEIVSTGIRDRDIPMRTLKVPWNRTILTKEQTQLMRRLYFTEIPLDEVANDYVKVIRGLLDTVDDLRAALSIERNRT